MAHRRRYGSTTADLLNAGRPARKASVGESRRGALINELEMAVRIAERREEFRAQHGPVRILMKDGKPVE